MFTGSSYHVYLILKKPVSHNFYQDYIAFGKNEHISFISKWARSISKKTKIPVTRGHKKTHNVIILDPSGTPSGKLARAPFSVHVKDSQKRTVFGMPKKSDFFDHKKIDGFAELVKL